jgi:peptidyl-prolyl cis-trans isomerase B (cyclophilin B)
MHRKPLITMTWLMAAGILAATAAWADDPATPAGQAPATTPPAAGTTAPAATTNKAANTATGTADKAASSTKSTTNAATEEVAVMATSKGTMVIAFWPQEAPQTVANFKKLARQGFYDGTGFHRIIKGFMIQGGDPKSKNPKAPDLGTGDPGYKIPDEFNFHKHQPGVISMANSGTPNSAGSQFFIMDGAAPFLDGHYTAFGYVIDGMKVFKEIANTPVAPNPMMNGEKSKPLEWTTVLSVKIVPKSSLKATEKADAKAEKAAATGKGATTTAKGAATGAASTTGAAPDTTKK